MNEESEESRQPLYTKRSTFVTRLAAGLEERLASPSPHCWLLHLRTSAIDKYSALQNPLDVNSDRISRLKQGIATSLLVL